MKAVIDKEKTAKNLWDLRKESNYSLNEMLDALDLETPAPIYRWESGVYMPSLDRLVKLAYLYGKTLDEIVAVTFVV